MVDKMGSVSEQIKALSKMLRGSPAPEGVSGDPGFVFRHGIELPSFKNIDNPSTSTTLNALSERWPDWVLDIVDRLKADGSVNLASYSQCLATLDVADRARIQMVVGRDRWFSVNVAATARFMRRGEDPK